MKVTAVFPACINRVEHWRGTHGRQHTEPTPTEPFPAETRTV